MLVGALSGTFLCSLLGRCVVAPAVGFPGSVLRGGFWWPGSCGPLCLFLFLFVFSLFVCFQVLLVAQKLDSPQRPCFFFFALPLSLFPGPVWHYYMLNIVTKINK